MIDKIELKKKEIEEYCFANNIANIDDFILKIFKIGFDLERYGIIGNEEKKIEQKEKPIEIIREVVDEKLILENQNLKRVVDDQKRRIIEQEKLIRDMEVLNNEGTNKSPIFGHEELNHEIEAHKKTIMEKEKIIEEKNKMIEELKKINKPFAFFMRGSNLK